VLGGLWLGVCALSSLERTALVGRVRLFVWLREQSLPRVRVSSDLVSLDCVGRPSVSVCSVVWTVFTDSACEFGFDIVLV